MKAMLTVHTFLIGLVVFAQHALGSEFPQSVYFFNHVHSKYSEHTSDFNGMKQKPLAIIKRASHYLEKSGRSALIAITDHEDVRSYDDLLEAGLEGKPGDRLIAIRSAEWGKTTHSGVIGVDPTWPLLKEPGKIGFEAQVAEAKKAAKFVIANHPDYSDKFWPWQRWGTADAVEIWNTAFDHFGDPKLAKKLGFGWIDNAATRKQWAQAQLETGRKIPGVSGSDFHFKFPRTNTERLMLFPANIVFADSNDPDTVLAAIRAGRVSMKARSVAPHLFLQARWNGEKTVVRQGDAVQGVGELELEILSESSEWRPEGGECEPLIGDSRPKGTRFELRLYSGRDLDQPLAKAYLPKACRRVDWKEARTIKDMNRDFFFVMAIDHEEEGKVAAITNPVYANGF